MTLDVIVGTLTTINSSFVNPYTGEILNVSGDYYINDTLVSGGAGTDDIALGLVFDQLWRLEDDLGNLLIENIEVFLPAPGNDIVLLASTTHILGDLTIQASEGDDIIWSNAGNDLIEGGLGNDWLDGGLGNDTINGGEDDDTLAGGAGDDTYIYNLGDGSDIISEVSGNDKIEFGAGIAIGDISFTQAGNDLILDMGETITLKDFYSGDPDKLVEQLVFSDASTFDLTTLLVSEPPIHPIINSIADAENLEDPTSLLNGLDEITIVLKVTAAQIGTDRGLFDTESADGRDDALTMRYDAFGWNGGGNNVIKIGLQTTEGQIKYESASNVQTTDTQHLVISWKTGEFFKLYIDGIEDTPTDFTGSLGGVISNVSDLLLGLGAKDAGGWDGSIDNFQVYDTAMDATEIHNLYVDADTNRTPDAFNDEFTGNQNSNITGNLMDDNGHGADSDPDGDVLNVIAGTYATGNGHLVLSDNGDFTYTPDSGFSGVDTFLYTLTDENGANSSATVTFTVGTLPNDTFFATSAAEHFDGGYGSDTVDYSASLARVKLNLGAGIGWDGDADDDTYTSIENVVGSDIKATGDFIYGSEADNMIWGMAGNDVLQGMGGADIIDGGAGSDYASYSRSDEGVNINLKTNINTGGDAEGDVLISINGIKGSVYDDVIVGGDIGNKLYGDKGDDLIYGGAGTDTLYGEEGADTFVFGAEDTFGFVDTIKDFSVAEGDKIDISDLLEGYDPLNDAISDFVQFTSVGSTNAHGAISVDADGSADNFVLIAYITDHPSLDAETLDISGNLITV